MEEEEMKIIFDVKKTLNAEDSMFNTLALILGEIKTLKAIMNKDDEKLRSFAISLNKDKYNKYIDGAKAVLDMLKM